MKRGRLKKASYHLTVKNGSTVCLIARTISEAKKTFMSTGWYKLSDIVEITRYPKNRKPT